MTLAQLVEAPAAERGQKLADDRWSLVGSTADQPGGFGPVDELDGAVVPEQEYLGDVSDGRPVPVLLTPYGEQELVLAGVSPTATACSSLQCRKRRRPVRNSRRRS